MEFSGLSPLGSVAAIAAEAPMRKASQIAPIATSDQARGAGTERRQHPEQESIAAEARNMAALRHEVERRALPVGPSPAFEMNLLEAEGGIDQVLARIEAARSRGRDGPALRPTAPLPKDAPPASTRSPVAHVPAESSVVPTALAPAGAVPD